MVGILPVFVLFAGSLLLALALAPLAIRLSASWGAMDQPGERKVHAYPMPRLGGVAIYAAFVSAAGAALLAQPQLRSRLVQDARFWGSIAAGATLVFLLGLVDDIFGLGVASRFAVQAVAGLVAIYGGGVRVTTITNPLDGKIELGWLAVPITLFWIVGVTNAFNLIDGLDGLAGGIAFISVTTIFMVTLLTGGRSLVLLATAALAGALLGFLRYNFYPARIFLGDCGSLFLGYMLAILSVVGSNKRTAALALLIPILIVGIPVFDTLNAMLRRLVRQVVVEKERKPSALLAMFRADRAHIHHMLIEQGLSHAKAVLVLYGLGLFFCLMALVAVLLENDRASFALMVAGFVGFILLRHYGHLLPMRLFNHAAGGNGEQKKL
ncbi:MAG: undecaprenyl/decaprenyl-phosphate alpha-N-acetylglucosaminyl 1-phosphate transferase [Acidobacteria bacterium]|nr:undecaprenyl/decaprenyl-phosphate alpha-N-acetylglucosaminyl 1-phosphate transferase [Acidobacteriota bacterium]